MARAFDSTTDRIELQTTAMPLIGSIAMWAWPNWAQTDGANHMFFSAHAAATQVFQILKFSNNSLFAGWFNTVEYRVVVATASYTLNQNAWNQVALTWDDTSNETKLYLNGSQIGSTGSTLVAFTTSHTRCIGNEAAEGVNDYNFDGRLAEFGLWDVVLNTSEIAALSKGFSPAMVRITSLLNYLPLVRETKDIKSLAATETNTAVADHPRIYHGRAQADLRLPAPAAVASNLFMMSRAT